MDITITRFGGITKTSPEKETLLVEVLDQIRSDIWKAKILKCKLDLNNKRWLPCFTPTGKFSHRSIAGLYEYNGVICLDIDHVDAPEALKAQCRGLSWCHAAFITPSYRGLKVIVLTDATQENYERAEQRVAQLFKECTGFDRDERARDISRAQYISWDPNLYYNPDSEILKSEFSFAPQESQLILP